MLYQSNLFKLFVIGFSLIAFPTLDAKNESNKKKADINENVKENSIENAIEKDPKNDAAEKNDEPTPPLIGNFSLPSSQQPSGLFAFGGNIIDKGEIQIFLFGDDFVGNQKTVSQILPSVLFGITAEWSVLFNFPFAPELREGNHHSNGLNDFYIQLEYAFYNHSTTTYIDQGILVANITVPTGSIKKNPPTGFGSPSLFLGATYNRMMVDWFVFTSPGAVLTTSDHGNKFGEQFLYQFGFGKNIPSPCGWIYAWMLEIDGQYNRKNRIHGHIDHNSGGNAIYATPSLFISTKAILFQLGFSIPINQNLFGNQRKVDYALNVNFAWSYY
jgi:hypothetical protein